MKKYELGEVGPAQYEGLTEAERVAWVNPEPHSYHSFHVERMGEHLYRWRDSRSAHFYVGTTVELAEALTSMKTRKVDPKWQEAMQQVQVLKILSQNEIDDLFADL